MADTTAQFDHRVRKIDRKHRAMTRGYTAKVRSDGLIVVKPRRAKPSLPIKQTLILIAAVILFKGFLLASIGTLVYETRVAKLQEGTFIEQAGAWVMAVEPASQFAARYVGAILP